MDKPTSTIVFRILKGTWILLLAAVCILALMVLIPIIYPFIIGWLIAYAMNPLVNLLQRKGKLPRWLATSVSLTAFAGVISLLAILLVNKIILEASRFAAFIERNMDSWVNNLIDFFNSDRIQELIRQFNALYTQNDQITQTVDDHLQQTGKQLSNLASSVITSLMDVILTFVTTLPSLTFALIIAILSAFFMSKDWYKWMQRISGILPETWKISLGKIWGELRRALFGYVRAQLIMISITAAFVMVGLLILGVDYAIVIGLLIGIVDLLPYLGTGAVMVPWIVYVFIQGNISLGIGLSLLYGIIFFTRSIIEPKVLAYSIGLDALSTLFAMVIGLHFFGALGIIIGPVTLVLLITLHKADLFRSVWRYILGEKPERA